STPASASAQASQWFQNQATGKCIDDRGVNGHYAADCEPATLHIMWDVHVYNDGTRQLKSAMSGQCIDDSEHGLRMYACNNGIFQSWYVRKWNDGTLEFKNQATGKCLDDSEFGLRTYPCNSSKFQSWF
ncbi:MAG: hypothetical protein QOI21_3028, partial [Actinomycetota bacterium]|nr:hypothetical protein [Actinomycetota bacterium]